MPDWRAIDAYLAGTATPEQREAVRRWVAESEANAAIVESMRAALSPLPSTAVDVDAAWSSVAKRVGIGSPSSRHARPFPMRRAATRRAWPIAIAAGVLLVASLSVLRFARSNAPVAELVTGSGQRITKTLDDGSTVILNAESRLRYSPDRNGRQVYLEGEAMFRVAHDSRRPFRVHAGGAVVSDIGTQFGVRAYPEVARVDVAVTEGSVSLHREGAPGDSLVLRAGSVGHVSAEGLLSIDPSERPAQMTAWLDGTLVFTGSPLAEVAAQLRRKYGVPVLVADTSLNARRVTATVHHETLTQALDAITLALGIGYERRGDTIVVTPRR
ncbi:MAG: FecR family protein [bacterium]